MFKCQYCNKEFEKFQSLSVHKSHCKLNPDKKRTHEKNSEASRKSRKTYISNHPELFEKREYVCKCKRCGQNYIVYVTSSQYLKGQYSNYCSRSCANTRVLTDETKKKLVNL